MTDSAPIDQRKVYIHHFISIVPSIDIPITQNTSIIWARGYLHQGRDSMELKVNNNTLCVSKAQYGAEVGGDIKSISLCPTPIKIAKGDVMQIVSIYTMCQCICCEFLTLSFIEI